MTRPRDERGSASVALTLLLPVLLVAPVLALYAYHYLDKPAAAWRTAISALCFSLLVVAMALVVAGLR